MRTPWKRYRVGVDEAGIRVTRQTSLDRWMSGEADLTVSLPWSEVVDVGVRVLDGSDDARPGPDVSGMLAEIERFRYRWPGAGPGVPAGSAVVAVRVTPDSRGLDVAFRYRMADAARHRAFAAEHGPADAVAELDAIRRRVFAWYRDRDPERIAVRCVLSPRDLDRDALAAAVLRHTGRAIRELGPLRPGDLDTPLQLADALAEGAEDHAGCVDPSPGV